MLTKILKYISTLDQPSQDHFIKCLQLHFSKEHLKLIKYFILIFKYLDTNRLIFRLRHSYKEALVVWRLPKIVLQPPPHWSHEDKMGYYAGANYFLTLLTTWEEPEKIEWNKGAYCGFIEYAFVKHGYISSFINKLSDKDLQ